MSECRCNFEDSQTTEHGTYCPVYMQDRIEELEAKQLTALVEYASLMVDFMKLGRENNKLKRQLALSHAVHDQYATARNQYERTVEDLEAMRWKDMEEPFPTKPTYLEIIYTNTYGYRWCEVHKLSKRPKPNYLGLSVPVLWRELTPVPKT